MTTHNPVDNPVVPGWFPVVLEPPPSVPFPGGSQVVPPFRGEPLTGEPLGQPGTSQNLSSGSGTTRHRPETMP